MSRRRNERSIKIEIPLSGRRKNNSSGIFTLLFVIAGIFTWIYLLTTEDIKKILWMVLAVNLILLVGNLIKLYKAGYQDFTGSMRVTYSLNVLFTTIGFYLTGISLMPAAEGNVSLLLGFLEFLVLLILSVFTAVLPTILLSWILWLTGSIFSN